MSKETNMISLGGLWIQKTKDGKSYMSGSLNQTVKILVFKNEQKRGEKDPAYKIYLAPKQQQQGPGNRPQPIQQVEEKDDLPF